MANYQDWKTPIVGGTDYVQKWALFVQASEDRDTELENARQGQPTLLANLQRKFDLVSGATAHLNMNGNRVTNAATAVNPTDLPNLQQVTALILGGANPYSIPVTALHFGTLGDGEFVVRAGGSLVGASRLDAFSFFMAGD